MVGWLTTVARKYPGTIRGLVTKTIEVEALPNHCPIIVINLWKDTTTTCSKRSRSPCCKLAQSVRKNVQRLGVLFVRSSGNWLLKKNPSFWLCQGRNYSQEASPKTSSQEQRTSIHSHIVWSQRRPEEDLEKSHLRNKVDADAQVATPSQIELDLATSLHVALETVVQSAVSAVTKHRRC